MSLPADFENYMKNRLGDHFNDFLSALQNAPPVSIRLNPAKLRDYEGEPIPWTQYGRYLHQRPVFTLDPRLHAGAYYVQEASSMFLEEVLRQTVDLDRPQRILDLCAAPGGKSTLTLSLITKDSLLISNEVIRSRASVLAENIQKWGNDNCIVTNNDPLHFQRLPGFFDVILLDAPCSGEGLFRKDADALTQWSSKNVEMCALRQRRIVSDVWPALKDGGIMIYSTCTYNQSENIDNLLWLKKEFDPDFIQLKIPAEWNVEHTGNEKVTGYQFFPHQVRGEGFFISVMRKKGDATPATPRIRDTIKHPTKAQLAGFSSWVMEPDQKLFLLHDQTVRMFAAGRRPELQAALNNLNVIIAGTAVLEIMKNKFVPDHALALSTGINRDAFRTIDVDEETAVRYLRKDPITLEGETGFALVGFQGLGLGWVNVLQNRINNLYPSSWRIRMGH
jgi:16S rRNA C967 or C1407 C5-methylase (RsmB/RsmF family)/NOL1/NOP2/fmu family ribosome biogenesis protein